ncbi:MAG: hypothetical protein ABFC63_00995 [Thermoguttaceae bacterium]
MSAFGLPLFADADAELVKFILILVIGGIAGIARLMASVRQGKPPVNGPRPDAPTRPVRGDVADEIDEFLRRAAQRRGTAPGRPTAAKPPRVQPSAPLTAQPVRADVAAKESPVGGKVTEHVRKYLDAEGFTQRADHLGEEVSRADQEADQHLHQVFDHDVSNLAATPGETALAPAAVEPTVETPPEVLGSLADGVLDVFSNPSSVRQAFVLGEVLRRPEDRWSFGSPMHENLPLGN